MSLIDKVNTSEREPSGGEAAFSDVDLRARGIMARLFRFAFGKEERFFVSFVAENPDHEELHQAFLDLYTINESTLAAKGVQLVAEPIYARVRQQGWNGEGEQWADSAEPFAITYSLPPSIEV